MESSTCPWPLGISRPRGPTWKPCLSLSRRRAAEASCSESATTSVNVFVRVRKGSAGDDSSHLDVVHHDESGGGSEVVLDGKAFDFDEAPTVWASVACSPSAPTPGRPCCRCCPSERQRLHDRSPHLTLTAPERWPMSRAGPVLSKGGQPSSERSLKKYPSQCQHRVVGKDYTLPSGERKRVY